MILKPAGHVGYTREGYSIRRIPNRKQPEQKPEGLQAISEGALRLLCQKGDAAAIAEFYRRKVS